MVNLLPIPCPPAVVKPIKMMGNEAWRNFLATHPGWVPPLKAVAVVAAAGVGAAIGCGTAEAFGPPAPRQAASGPVWPGEGYAAGVPVLQGNAYRAAALGGLGAGYGGPGGFAAGYGVGYVSGLPGLFPGGGIGGSGGGVGFVLAQTPPRTPVDWLVAPGGSSPDLTPGTTPTETVTTGEGPTQPTSPGTSIDEPASYLWLALGSLAIIGIRVKGKRP